MIRNALLGLSLAGVGAAGGAVGQSPSKPLSEGGKNLPAEPGAGAAALPPAPNDGELVERGVAARREYENSLRALHGHYFKAGDKLRMQWAEQELIAFHLMFKPSYNLDVKDVPPPTLEASVNVREANELFRAAMEYK